MKPMETYDVLHEAFQFFNKELFGGKLSDCLIVLHRKRSAYGYFWAEQFTGKVHEIALNPEHIRTRKPRDTFSTLVHEMVHQLQQEHGKPPKGAYHNKQWASMMRDVGLQPDDGQGNETGRCVSHRIINGGRFDTAFKNFAERYDVNLLGTMPATKKEKGKTSKFKFACPECEQNAWAKQTAKLICGECNEEMEEA
jgi:predicted SprT family Zn-dependent metalloprotease